MARTVFILGAGASADAGVPLMGDFLQTAHDLTQHEGFLSSEDKKAFGEVFDATQALRSVHSRASLSLKNIERVWGAFETGNLIGKLPNYNGPLQGLLDATKVLIVRTVEETLRMGAGLEAPPPYGEFAKLLVELRRQRKPLGNVALVTFNWDLGLECAIREVDERYDYGLREGAGGGAIPLLKLHGSINWGSCPKCGSVNPLSLSKMHREERPPFRKCGTRLFVLLPSAELSKPQPCQQCAGAYTSTSVIVPPTWNKLSYAPKISMVWRRAADELSEAENIFVIGYSFPASDESFPHLYGLGGVGAAMLKRLWVYDPDPEVAKRFEKFLGPEAQAPTFRPFRARFSVAIRGTTDNKVVSLPHALELR